MFQTISVPPTFSVLQVSKLSYSPTRGLLDVRLRRSLGLLGSTEFLACWDLALSCTGGMPNKQPGFGRTPGLISNPKISEMMLEMLKIDAPPERGLMLSGV